MSGHGAGVYVTRAIELPFPPWEGLRIFSTGYDECPSLWGFTLKDVIWDVDHQVFLAETEYVYNDYPIPFIPDLIRVWIDHGWRLGSYRDAYPDPDDAVAMATSEADDDDDGGDEWEEAEKAQEKTWKGRSAESNRIFKALIRHMAETFDNDSAAYAFDRTGRFFTQREVDERKTTDADVRTFDDAAQEFERMSFQNRQKWRDRTAKYPIFEDVMREEP